MNNIDFINQSFSEQQYVDQELGNGYFRLTNGYFDEDSGGYGIIGQILDENHNVLGSGTFGGYVYNFHQDDYNITLQYFTDVNLKGDVKKILSL